MVCRLAGPDSFRFPASGVMKLIIPNFHRLVVPYLKLFMKMLSLI